MGKKKTQGGSEDEVSPAVRDTFKCKSATSNGSPLYRHCGAPTWREKGGRDIVCNLICNVSMNIHAASITRSLYSSHTKLRLAQRGRSFLLSGGVSLPPPTPLVSPRSLSHGEAPHGNDANDLTRRRTHGAKQSGTLEIESEAAAGSRHVGIAQHVFLSSVYDISIM